MREKIKTFQTLCPVAQQQVQAPSHHPHFELNQFDHNDSVPNSRMSHVSHLSQQLQNPSATNCFPNGISSQSLIQQQFPNGTSFPTNMILLFLKMISLNALANPASLTKVTQSICFPNNSSYFSRLSSFAQ